jgi:hypothetical protein
MIIGRIRLCLFCFVIFFSVFFGFFTPFFMFIGGAAERAGIFKDDIIIKVFS